MRYDPYHIVGITTQRHNHWLDLASTCVYTMSLILLLLLLRLQLLPLHPLVHYYPLQQRVAGCNCSPSWDYFLHLDVVFYSWGYPINCFVPVLCCWILWFLFFVLPYPVLCWHDLVAEQVSLGRALRSYT